MNINTLKKESEGKTKIKFKEYLITEIKKIVNCQVDSLEYGDKRIKKVLLLFNIQTILSSRKAEMKFPFFKYKTDKR